MKSLRYHDLCDIGIEPIRAEALTYVGEPYIYTDGENIFIDSDFEPAGTIESFVNTTNEQPFDYAAGYWEA